MTLRQKETKNGSNGSNGSINLHPNFIKKIYVYWLELKSMIFENLFQKRTPKAPKADFCIVNAAAGVLDG